MPPPNSVAAPSARSLGQIRRHQRARENRPVPPPQASSNRSLAQRARRERERAEKAARMDVAPPPVARNSRVLQAIHNGLPTPPATQQGAAAAGVGVSKSLISHKPGLKGHAICTQSYTPTQSKPESRTAAKYV
ncbi:hypothetical protein R3P38DRAFT_2800786 [Favolaschia claudopus]|uniref:Uncharacterized protein n=1 Tax=Favolaschia claudopus TaxID=2862362 RepID=A0AAV9ZXS3_9AGAR